MISLSLNSQDDHVNSRYDRIIGDGEILIFDDLWEYYETRVSVNIDLDCNGDGEADCSAVISSEPLYTPCW